jgi:flagellar hook-length control protein FliK
MTPHSTERAPKMSPLDIFGAMPHSPAAGAEPSPAFKAVLNKATAPARTPLHRQPVPPSGAEHPQQDSDARKNYATDKVSPPAGKKQPLKAAPNSRPQRKEDDRETGDDPAAKQIGAPPATDSSPASPQPQDTADDPGAAQDEGTQPVDAASEQALADDADAPQPQVALGDQLADAVLQPNPSSETSQTSQPEPDATAAAMDEKSATVKQPELPSNQGEATGNGALSPRQDAPAVQDSGELSQRAPEQDPANATDPIAAMDQQTAAAAVEIQPLESSGNRKEDKGSDSQSGDDPQQSAADGPQQLTPSPDILTPETQSAAAPPPAADSAQALPKDAPPPQHSASQPAAGVQSSPSRLPQHVLARSEGHQIHNPAPVPVDTARFLSRVAKAFLSAQQRDGNEVRLRLSPPELGSLRLQVSVQDGVMVARMETETEAARSSLVNNLPDLRERLAEQGIRVERFDIDLMQRPSTGTPDRPSDPQQQNEPQPLRPLRSQQSISDAPTPTTLGNNWNGQGRLNVII